MKMTAKENIEMALLRKMEDERCIEYYFYTKESWIKFRKLIAKKTPKEEIMKEMGWEHSSSYDRQIREYKNIRQRQSMRRSYYKAKEYLEQNGLYDIWKEKVRLYRTEWKKEKMKDPEYRKKVAAQSLIRRKKFEALYPEEAGKRKLEKNRKLREKYKLKKAANNG